MRDLKERLSKRRKMDHAFHRDYDIPDPDCAEALARIEALEAMLQKIVIQERRVAASPDMTRSAMREGAAELANQIDAALRGGGDE